MNLGNPIRSSSQWIGIDISPTAYRVMAKRLRDVCSMKESEPLWKAHRDNAFVVRDLPWTVEKLHALPHFEFEKGKNNHRWLHPSGTREITLVFRMLRHV